MGNGYDYYSLNAAEMTCVPQETTLNNVKLAHAYVPFQKLCTTFAPMSGLKKGTIFPPLTNLYEWEKNNKGEVVDDD